jgi:uncharacterized protein
MSIGEGIGRSGTAPPVHDTPEQEERMSDPIAPATTRGNDAPRSHGPTSGVDGWITHTELASQDPSATRAWCANVLGWTFMPPFPTPAGDYHLFAYSEKGGGGIRSVAPPEAPGSIPYVHVADVGAAFERALEGGAEAMLPPERVMEGVTIAIVRAPGGVAIGFSGP